MEVIFREFRKSDLDGLFFLDKHCYAEPYRFQYHQLVSTLLDRDVASLVIQRLPEADGLAGALILKAVHWERQMSIMSLMIGPDFQRSGLGKKLMAWAEQFTASNGIPTLTIALEKENETGAAFLQSCGFEDSTKHAPYFQSAEEGTLWTKAVLAKEGTMALGVAESGKPEAGKTGPGKTEPEKTKTEKTKPGKRDAGKTEPAIAEPAKTESEA